MNEHEASVYLSIIWGIVLLIANFSWIWAISSDKEMKNDNQ